MHVDFVVCYFSIWMSGYIVKEVIGSVVNVFSSSYEKMCGNKSNWSYNGGVNGTGIEEEGADDLLAVEDLWLC